jgi:molecular chaperone GrpE
VTDRPGEHRDERDPTEEHGPVVRDKRRIDPVTGAVREPAAGDSPPAPAGPVIPDSPADGLGDDVADELSRQIAERTADLQRLQAEYLNYKRRVDRDRDLVRENATYAALAPIVDVLDTIDRAREHGDLDDGFQAVADQLERVVSNAGLVKYGEPGDAFDPRIHEALSHIGEDPDVEVTTCKVIAKAGYRIGERVVRAAQVLVVDPASG